VKCIDESGANLAMTRVYGCAPIGERVIGSVPQHDGQHVTRLGALGVQGLHAVMTVDGVTDTEDFRSDVRQVLGPTLAQGDTVVVENLRAYKAVGIQQALARRGARLLYLPPHSPDLSPIEPCWSKIKTFLRAAKARTCEALDAEVTRALAMVRASDARAWFAHSGYVLH
jgi:transposase